MGSGSEINPSSNLLEMSSLQEIAIKIKQQSIQLTDPGLQKGQMGCFIFLLYYINLFQKKEYIECANNLFISLITKLNKQFEIGDPSKRLDIAIGLLHLSHQNLFHVKCDLLHRSLSSYVNSTIIYDLSLIGENVRKRLIPIGYYLTLLIRESNRDELESMKKQFLYIHLLDLLERFATPQTEDEKMKLILFLEQAYLLNVCNTKVIRIIKKICKTNDLDTDQLSEIFSDTRKKLLQDILACDFSNQMGLQDGWSQKGLALLSKDDCRSTEWLNLI